MTTIEAVYRDGVLHPSVPLDLKEGTSLRLRLVEEPLPPVIEPLVGADLVSYIRSRGSSEFDPDHDNPAVSARNVDEVLYGGPGGVR